MAIAHRFSTIAGRLYLLGGVALLAVALLSAVSIYFAMETRRVADALYRSGFVGAIEAGELQVLVERYRRLIETAPPGLAPERVAGKLEAIGEMAQQASALAEATADPVLRGLLPGLSDLWQAGRAALDLGGRLDGDLALSALGQFTKVADAVEQTIRRHRMARVEQANRVARDLSAQSRQFVIIVTGFGLVAALLVGPLALILLRRAIVRLDRVTAAMRRLAANDTAFVATGAEGSDEIGKMAEAVAVFRTNAVRLLEQQSELAQLNRWLDIALNNMARGLSMFDQDQRLLVCNAAYQRLYGLNDALTSPGVSFAEILAHRRPQMSDIDGADDPGTALEHFARTRVEGRLRQRLADGRIIDISAKPLPWGGWVALHEDVTERVAAAEKIQRLAQEDTLTGLANRHTFRERLDRATAGLEQGGGGFALIAIDLDKFKEVNDTLGHPTGDALLAAVGRRLLETVRRGDLVARLGGDEFAILQLGASRASEAEGLARRAVEALARPFEVLGHRIEIGGTAGIALAPGNGRTAHDILRNADLALYRAKTERRGTWRLFDPEMEGRVRARRSLETDLAQARNNGELELHYQPIVSLSERRVSGCEALIRWRHPVRGNVSPGEFIPIAESSGLIADIGAFALEEACRAAARWPSDLRVAVNLSVAQVTGTGLARTVANALAASGLEAQRLELEVTESILLGDDPATLEVLFRLRGLGIGFALDDFGTGYSSLSHLRSFPFDKLKIDQTFVRDLPQRRNCEAIVGAVARLASSLDMTTVAEGVETEEHLERVRAAGCDEVQGYLFSRPVPEAQLADAIQAIDMRLGSARAAA